MLSELSAERDRKQAEDDAITLEEERIKAGYEVLEDMAKYL